MLQLEFDQKYGQPTENKIYKLFLKEGETHLSKLN